MNTNLCWHFKGCINGCPFSHAMDYPPNGIIRLAQIGLRKEALPPPIWICIDCNTCAVQCPNAIDILAVNDALRQMSLEEGAEVAEPDILAFHKGAFLAGKPKDCLWKSSSVHFHGLLKYSISG